MLQVLKCEKCLSVMCDNWMVHFLTVSTCYCCRCFLCFGAHWVAVYTYTAVPADSNSCSCPQFADLSTTPCSRDINPCWVRGLQWGISQGITLRAAFNSSVVFIILIRWPAVCLLAVLVVRFVTVWLRWPAHHLDRWTHRQTDMQDRAYGLDSTPNEVTYIYNIIYIYIYIYIHQFHYECIMFHSQYHSLHVTIT